MASAASNIGTSVVDIILGSDAFLGLGLAFLCLFLGILGTWGILRQILVAYGATSRQPAEEKGKEEEEEEEEEGDSRKAGTLNGKYDNVDGMRSEAFLAVRLESILVAFGAAITGIISGLIEAVKESLANVSANFPYLIGLAIAAGLGFAFNSVHDIILPVVFTSIQCVIQPVMVELIYPLLNFARLIYALVWPWINMYVFCCFSDVHNDINFCSKKDTRRVISLDNRTLLWRDS
jgi:hypothetical protein